MTLVSIQKSIFNFFNLIFIILKLKICRLHDKGLKKIGKRIKKFRIPFILLITLDLYMFLGLIKRKKKL